MKKNKTEPIKEAIKRIPLGADSYSILFLGELDSPNDFLSKVDGRRMFTDKGRRTNT